ncbi:MAG: Flp family type IVb pilin [Siculibacillus sp.]
MTFQLLKRFVRDESGATAIEYGLIASLVALAIIAGARTLGTNIGQTFNKVAGNVK